MFGTMTQATCGAACWYAREDACRCSCAGANHGCLLQEGAEQPRRNCSIKGTRYVLAGVGRWAELDAIERAFCNHPASNPFRIEVYGHQYVPHGRAGSVILQRRATASQARWAEVAEYAAAHPSMRNPECLWVREDAADALDEVLASL